MTSQRLTAFGSVAIAAAALLLGSVNCRSRSSAREGEQTELATVDVADEVKVSVDGKVVTTLATSDFETPLSQLVPGAAADPTSWRRLEAQSRQGQVLHIDDVATSYPTQVVRVFLDAKNRPSIGLFAKADDGGVANAKPTLQIVNLKRIDISTVVKENEKVDPIALTIQSTNGLTRGVRESALQALAISGRGGGNKRLKGWQLVDVLSIVSAKPLAFKTLRAQGTTADDKFEIERATLEGEGMVTRLKRNNRGLLRMRVFRTSKTTSDNEQPEILYQINDLKRLTLHN